MLRPTPGELLAGVRHELKEQVLPALPAGAAARQLKAALHVLDQVARTWDLQHAYLAADNADLDATLTDLARLSGQQRTAVEPPKVPIPGVTDTGFRELLTRNEALQTELDAWQRDWRAAGRADHNIDGAAFALHTRMVARAATAGGVTDDG